MRISGGVPDHQLKGSSGDPARVIDLVNGQLQSGYVFRPSMTGIWSSGGIHPCRSVRFGKLLPPDRAS